MVDPFQGAAADLEPLPPATGDLWDRIVQGYAIPDLEGPLVEKWEQWYAERPDYVARMVERSRRYLYHIVSEVEARGMPLEIALLPIVESAFNPNAMSVSRASGIWQFMPSTGNVVRPQADVVVRFAARRRRRNERRARLPAEAERRVQRLAAVARRVQLGRRQRAARDRAQPCKGSAGGLRQPDQDGRRDAQLRAEAAGGQEHHRRSGSSTDW